MTKKSFSFLIDEKLLYKLHVVSKSEGRSVSKQIRFIIRETIKEFEAEHGTIEIQ